MNTQDYSQLSDSDLKDRLVQVRGELGSMKFNHTITGLENPNVLRLKRREVARLMTELNARANKA